jgi:uncharacterized membrane protein YjjB (DUF3815 family)
MTQYLIQTLAACLGSLGFAVLFNIKGKKLFLIACGGGISWIVYLTAKTIGADNAILGMFISTMAVAILAEISARVIKTPVITLLVPMVIPLIPGGDLYHTMTYLVQNDMSAFADSSKFAASEAGAIAFGILVVTSLVQIITKTSRYLQSAAKRKENACCEKDS